MLVAGSLVLFSGCGGKDFDYQPDHELKPGPGLFSGEDGEFTLIGSPKKKKKEAEQQQKRDEQNPPR